jgi:hypothetical protein
VVHGSTGKNSVNEFAVRENLLVAVLESKLFPRNEPNPKILTADCPPHIVEMQAIRKTSGKMSTKH